ncbi:MAG: FAD-dependent oxidoreductase [Mangrovicoccus sp.]|nr:FAD-dependent oxidoreductase [Mangrovicoccus sp.]
MIDIAILGGGLCGLVLAEKLQSEGKSCRVFEARSLAGGRIRTRVEHGHAIDLGPSWFWPQTQPLIQELIARLGLSAFPQYDSGAVLALTDPEKGPETHSTEPIHEGAHRLDGGLITLVQALEAQLEAGTIAYGHTLAGLSDQGDHVQLRFQTATGSESVTAGQVVLAVPPRLLLEQVEFTPALPPALIRAMEDTETWMAQQAKAVVSYPAPDWREDGYSGNAFVNHERVVLSELFDQSHPSGSPGAIGGFLALDPETRASFSTGLDMLIRNQISQLYGAQYDSGSLAYQDWATEPLVCSARDKSEPSHGRRFGGHPLLRLPHWGAKLYFAGTETARSHAGHMEGALHAAYRVAEQTVSKAQITPPTALPNFADWLLDHGEGSFETYRTALNRLLSQQMPQDATRHAAGESITAFFEQALAGLWALDLKASQMADPNQRNAALTEMKPVIKASLNRLLGEIMGFNRSSCALRNFPQEHELPEAYLREILQDASALGQDFLTEAEHVMTIKAEAA